MVRKHLNASHLLSSEMLLQIFLDAGQSLIKEIDDDGKKVTFFYVKDLDSIHCIERKLSKYIDNNAGDHLNLVSNKRKPLYLISEYVEIGVLRRWNLIVCQKNAQGDIINILPSTDSLVSEFYSVLKPIQVEFEYHEKNLHLINIQKKRDMQLLDFLFFLNKDDLGIFLTRRLISKEVEMVKYTFRKLKSDYDECTERIDSNYQKELADEKNKTLLVMINLCEKVAENHGFTLVGE